jgi:PAS domain S-box-containing protein
MTTAPSIQGTILIVDDDRRNLKVLNTFLASAGYQVLLAKDGFQCLESAELGRPDVILLDIVMLEMDGYETCRRLKATPATAPIPVIFISALAEQENILQGFEAGGVDYITKPFRREEVLARVNAHVTIQQQKTELTACNRDLEREVREKERLAASLAKSERRLNAAQALAGLGSCERDLISDKGQWSQNQYRLFGYEPGEVPETFDRFKQHVHPDDLDRVVTSIEEHAHHNRPYHIEFRYIPAGGEIRHAHSIVEVECDENGRPVRIQGTFQDITDRKKAEKELKKSREWYRALYDSVADAIFIHPMTADGFLGPFTEVNDVACRLLGYAREELLALSPLDIDVSASEMDSPALARRLSRHQSLTFERLLGSKEGRRIPVEIHAKAFEQKGDSMVLSIARDLTERKRAEEERLLMERRLQTAQRLESLGILAGGIAHDFNNILMAVLGNIELAKEDLPREARAQRFLQESENATHRAVHLVRQMLAYAGKGQFVAESIDIGDLIRESARTLRTAVSGKAALGFDLTTDLPPVEGDLFQLQQLLSNLVINAAEACEKEDGGSVTIATGVQHCDSTDLSDSLPDVFLPYHTPFPKKPFVFIDIRDNGCGMGPDTQKRIFEPFFTTKFQGRGLGLAAATGIVRGHSGYIRVESEPGQGSVFRVLLPAMTETP